MAYSELVKSLNPIRSYMRDFFVYGFKHRNDYPESQRRSYDNEKRRLQSWLDKYMRFYMNPFKQKIVFLSIDSRKCDWNPLYKAFLAKSFTDKDVMFHFFLLDILSDGKERTSRMLWDEVSAYPLPDVPDESTIRKKCREYAALGVFLSRKEGRSVYYRLAESIPTDALVDLLAFACEAMPLGVLGSYLLETTECYPISIAFKHHYIFPALDAEILEVILAGLEEKREVRLIFPDKEEKIVFPWKIFISTETGRQYLLGLSDGRPTFTRLDRVETAKLGDVEAKAAEKEEILAGKLPHLWGVSGGDWKTVYHVEMVIRLESTESFVIDRLQREKRCGRVFRVSPGLWKYEADVYDPLEMLPWLRTFIGRIESLSSDHPELERRFFADFDAMERLYEEDTQ